MATSSTHRKPKIARPPPEDDTERSPHDLAAYAAALEEENLKLLRKLARTEAELLSSRNRVKILEEAKPEAVVRTMSREELLKVIQDGAQPGGNAKSQK